jgi:hypothetical protein
VVAPPRTPDAALTTLGSAPDTSSGTDVDAAGALLSRHYRVIESIMG